MIDALQYPFFIRSLIVVIVLSIIFPLYGNIVILRKEANIAHAFSHMGLLGIAIGVRFKLPLELTILGSIILTIVLLRLLAYRDRYSFDANNEILAQLGLVGSILLVSQMTGYRSDISTYLFGDILLIRPLDVVILLIVGSVALCMYFFVHKQWYAISINREIALSRKYSVSLSSLLYVALIGILIGVAMKIIGVLLVSAFLVLPSNIAKLLAKNQTQRNIFGILISTLFSVIALFLAWYLNFPAGASIVGILICGYLSLQAYFFVKGKK